MTAGAAIGGFWPGRIAWGTTGVCQNGGDDAPTGEPTSNAGNYRQEGNNRQEKEIMKTDMQEMISGSARKAADLLRDDGRPYRRRSRHSRWACSWPTGDSRKRRGAALAAAARVRPCDDRERAGRDCHPDNWQRLPCLGDHGKTHGFKTGFHPSSGDGRAAVPERDL